MSETNGHISLKERRQQWREVLESVVSDFYTGQDRLRGLDSNSAIPLVSSTRQDHKDVTLRLFHEHDYNTHRANARLLAATNPYARAMIRALINAAIGHGGTVKADDKGIQLFCEDWLASNSWNCSRVELYDDSRVLPPKEVQALLRIYRDGEAVIRHSRDEDEENPSTLIDFIDPERIQGDGNGWHFGMLLNELGHPTAYRVCWDYGEEQIIPASDITFVPHPETDSTLLRGLPEIVYGVRDLLISALKQTTNIALGVQLRSALVMVWQWAFNEDSPEPASIMDQIASRKVVNEATGKRETITQGGTVANIPEGCEPVELPTDQTSQYREGVRTVLEALAGSQNLPYFIFGDSQTANYASAREAGTPFVRQAEMWQSYMSRVTLRLLTRALREAVEEGVISEERVKKANLTYIYPDVATSTPKEDAETTALLKDAGLITTDEGREDQGRDPVETSNR